MYLPKIKDGITGIALAVLLAGCSGEKEQNTITSRVVAQVGELPITEAEVDHQLSKLSGLSSLADQTQVREKMLESLVLAKLMAQKQLASMSTDELKTLDLEVSAYREERLAHGFLTQSVNPQPPSVEQVSDFYQGNLHRFGGGEFVTIETWTLGSNCKVAASDSNDVTALRGSLTQAGCEKTKSRDTLLLTALAKKMKIKQQGISIQTPLWRAGNGAQTVTFVEKIAARQAKPLVEVASDIRKMLAPIQLRAAIAESKAQLLKEMDVEFFDK